MNSRLLKWLLPMYLVVPGVALADAASDARRKAEADEQYKATMDRLDKHMKATDARIKELDEQAKKPNPRIGMTTKQVIEQSNWGRPVSINTTTTANRIEEQWVYDGGYLYFTNGLLTAIQN